MKIEKLVVGPLQENCYIVADENTGEALIVDPGDEPERIIEFVAELGVTVTKLIGTHGHVDHIGAVEPLKRQFGVPFYLHPGDELFLAHTAENGLAFGMQGLENPVVDEHLKEGNPVNCGQIELQVFEVPGHSPGSIILVAENHALVGDLVFSGSIGRTDLPGGDYAAMMASLESKLLTLPETTKLYPGHGDSTILAVERQYNPFLRGLAHPAQ